MTDQAARNRRAFLDTIAYSELGPALLAVSDNGYDVVVGSTPGRLLLFPRLSGKPDYRRHPNMLRTVWIKGRRVDSTAAGRYQILSRYADHYTQMLRLADFGPASQDAIALQLIKECKATDLIEAGNFQEACYLCRSRWASLPGAGYGQHENKLADLEAAYTSAGGEIA